MHSEEREVRRERKESWEAEKQLDRLLNSTEMLLCNDEAQQGYPGQHSMALLKCTEVLLSSGSQRWVHSTGFMCVCARTRITPMNHFNFLPFQVLPLYFPMSQREAVVPIAFLVCGGTGQS